MAFGTPMHVAIKMLFDSGSYTLIHPSQDDSVNGMLLNLANNHIIPMIDMARSDKTMSLALTLLDAHRLVNDLLNEGAYHFLVEQSREFISLFLNGMYQELSNLTCNALLFEFEKQFLHFNKFTYGLNQIYSKMSVEHTRYGHGSGTLVTECISHFNQQLMSKIFARLRDACLHCVETSRHSQSMQPTLHRALKHAVDVILLCATTIQTPAFELIRSKEDKNSFIWKEAAPAPHGNVQMVGGPKISWLMDPVLYQTEIEAPLIRSSAATFTMIHARNEILSLEKTDVSISQWIEEIMKFLKFELDFIATVFTRDSFKIVLETFMKIFVEPRFDLLLSDPVRCGVVQFILADDLPNAVRILRFLQITPAARRSDICSRLTSTLLDLLKPSVAQLEDAEDGDAAGSLLKQISQFLLLANNIATDLPICAELASIIAALMDASFFATVSASPAANQMVQSTRPSSPFQHAESGEQTDREAKVSALVSSAAKLSFEGLANLVRHATQDALEKVMSPSLSLSLSRLLPTLHDRLIKKGAVSLLPAHEPASSCLLRSDADVVRDIVENCLVILSLTSLDKDLLFEGIRGVMSKRLLSMRDEISKEMWEMEFKFTKKIQATVGYQYTIKMFSILSDVAIWKPFSPPTFAALLGLKKKVASSEPEWMQWEGSDEAARLVQLDNVEPCAVNVAVLRGNSWVVKDELAVSMNCKQIANSDQDVKMESGNSLFSMTKYNAFANIVDCYTRFFETQHSGRKLTWLPSISTAEVDYLPSSTTLFKSRITFIMSTVHASILMLFNHEDLFKEMEEENGMKKGLMVSRAADILGLPISEVARHLVSLTVGSAQKILTKHANEKDATEKSNQDGYKDVKAHFVFCLNEGFKAEKEKVVVQVVKKEDSVDDSKKKKKTLVKKVDDEVHKERKSVGSQSLANASFEVDSAAVKIDEEAIMKERKYIIDAAVVRHMKSQRNLAIDELFNVISGKILTNNGFGLDRKFFESQIESLVDKEYLEWSALDAKLIKYVA